jgi:serine/threonine-protein kinase
VIGETIGNFKIVSRLGRGGMGEVWLAEQQSIGTKVAIKLLNASVSEDTEHVQRFFNEARAVSRIQHAGIVKIFDVGHHAGHAYLVMEYLEGESLAQRIAQAQRLPLTDLCEIGRQAASILDATHSAGITHRDLKPDNIFIVPDRELARGYRVKILDFGIAKLTGTLAGISPRTTGTMGTPAYMAPEQWGDASKVDWRADLYSLGCVTFEMACGRPPFIVSNIAEACAKHLHDAPPHVRELAPETPPALDALVDRLLAKSAAARAESMRDVERAFVAIGSGNHQAAAFASTVPSFASAPRSSTASAPSGISSPPTSTQQGRVSASVMQTNAAARPRTGLPLVAKIAVGVLALFIGLAVFKKLSPRRRGAVASQEPQEKTPEVPPDKVAEMPSPPAQPPIDAAVEASAVRPDAAPPPRRPNPVRPKVGSTTTADAPIKDAKPANDGKPVKDDKPDKDDKPIKEGTIDAEGVFQAALRDKGIQNCYLSEVKRDPALGGKLTASVWIDETGRATKVSATGVSNAVERCVEGRLKAIHFPKAVGGPVNAYIPFTFEPPAPEDVAKGGTYTVHAGGAEEMRVSPTAADIKEEMTRVTSLLSNCKGTDTGRIVLTIKPDGRVGDAKVVGTLAGTELATCVEKGVIARARFPESKSGVKATVQFHLPK